MSTVAAVTTTTAVPSTVDAPPDRPWRRRVIVGSILLLVLLLTQRLGWHTLTNKVPDLGDPILYGWGWNWMRDTVFSNPSALYDGNIFWPHQQTVAYTDNMVALLPPFTVMRGLGAGWALQLNLLVLGMLGVSLAATYSLTRRLTGRIDASIFAAVAYTLGGFTTAHIGHPQLLMLGQFPLGFLFAFRWLEHRRVSDAIWFGVVNASFFLGSLYFAAIWTVCVAVVIVGYLIATRLHPGRRFWTGLTIVALFSALALPFVVPYFDLDQERALVPEWGLNASDLVTVPPGDFLYPGLDEWANDKLDRWEHSFFLGFSTLVLAAGGLAVLVTTTVRRRRRLAKPEDAPTAGTTREYWLLIAAGTAALILALGPEVRGVEMPFTWFHDNVPGFGGIRVAARLVVPALLAAAVLAGLGLSTMLRRLRSAPATGLAIAITALLILELSAPWTRVPLADDTKTLAVYRALAERPDGAVAELPIQSPVDGAAWARIEAPRMLYSTLDLHPRINGYSGSWPDGYLARVARFNRFPAASTLRAARRLDVRYFVLHTGTASGYPQYDAADVRKIVRALPPHATARRYGSSWLVDLGPSGA